MTLGDLVPWGRKDRDLALQSHEPASFGSSALTPFTRLHQEMNRLFDDAFRDFGLPSAFTGGRGMAGWPQIEVSETDDGYRLTAELPGMDEKDVDLSLQDGVLILRGEKRSEQGDEGRGYSERYYGAFERRIPVGDIDEGKVDATFNKGVLTVTLPRSPQAQERVKRIPINGATRH
jgi:HSP20 family protein